MAQNTFLWNDLVNKDLDLGILFQANQIQQSLWDDEQILEIQNLGGHDEQNTQVKVCNKIGFKQLQ